MYCIHNNRIMPRNDCYQHSYMESNSRHYQMNWIPANEHSESKTNQLDLFNQQKDCFVLFSMLFFLLVVIKSNAITVIAIV